MKEVWKDIKGYEGLYMISNKGRVMSLKNKITILKAGANADGYRQVCLSNNGRRWFRVCRLVGLHFVSGYQLGLQINHINENKSDDRAENLEWVTSKYNNNFGTRTERASKSVSKKLRKAIVMCDLSGNAIRKFDGVRLAERETGIKGIRNAILGKERHKTAGGYRWAYAN